MPNASELARQEAEQRPLQFGDRVRYTGSLMTACQGREGTVSASRTSCAGLIQVQFVGDTFTTGCFPESLTRIDEVEEAAGRAAVEAERCLTLSQLKLAKASLPNLTLFEAGLIAFLLLNDGTDEARAILAKLGIDD